MSRAAHVAVVALLMSPAAVADAAAPTVPFRTVARDGGASSALATPGIEVVKSVRRWRERWHEINAGAAPTPRLPRVDFSRHMLLLVKAGRRPTAGYGVRVTRITDRGSRLRVIAEERRPGSACVVPQVLTAPYHVVRVRRGPERATVTRRLVTDGC